MKKTLFAFVAICGLFMSGCLKDNYSVIHPPPAPGPPKPCDTVSSFSLGVTPIFTKYGCTAVNCHATAGTPGSGVVLDTWKGTNKANNNGLLLPAINHAQANGNGGIFWMPLTGNSLTACEVAQITKWANEGAPNN